MAELNCVVLGEGPKSLAIIVHYPTVPGRADCVSVSTPFQHLFDQRKFCRCRHFKRLPAEGG